MNRYVSSKEALDILSRLAPRVWCKKLLTCLLFEGGIKAYALGGHLIGRVPILLLLDDESIAPCEGERFWEAVRAKYGPSSGLGPETGKTTPRGTLFQVTGARWYADEGNASAHEIGFGYFFNADSLDWDAGTLRIESIFPNEIWRELFLEDDAIFNEGGYLAQPRFSWLEFEVELSGLCFERGAIEMLTGLEQPTKSTPSNRLGRPRKWDWDGALASIAATASKDPDGLPEGQGAQAKLEAMISDWFVDRTGECPAESEVRVRAAKILEAVKEGRK